MADIATVIRKTIDGLPVNSPAIRQKVYERARSAILSKLETRDPRPPQDAIDKQMAVVDKMISAVEEDYSFREQVDTVFAEAAAPVAPAVVAPAVPAAPSLPVAAVSEPVMAAPVSPPSAPEPMLDDVFRETASVAAPVEPAPALSSVAPALAEPQAAPVATPAASEPVAPVLPRKIEPARAKSRTSLVASLALLLLAGGGAYAAWLNKDMIGEKFAALTTSESPAAKPAKPTADAKPATTQPATAPAAKPAEEPATKFTQRLNTDGSETDTGTPTLVAGDLEEGKSVAQATQPSTPAKPAAQPVVPTAEPAAPAAQTAEPAAPATPQPSQPAIAVGQRAIFYEERTAAEQGTADQGNVVWAQVEESPGGDKPAEPAIRGTITFPERGLSLRITIRRNGDATLPASHIIEMVFLPPENFPAGSFDDVLRITFKGSEQAPGTPLLGIPAKIADNFFLVALTDGKAEVETNEKLLATEQWIDIPVIYRTGRRALITMEKGLPGEKVFKDVVAAWQTNPLAQ